MVDTCQAATLFSQVCFSFPDLFTVWFICLCNISVH
jgi:hypothetical protein